MRGKGRSRNVWPTPPQDAAQEQVSPRVLKRRSGIAKGTRGSKKEWFSGKPTGDLLTEGTAGAIFEILEAPVVSTGGKKILRLVFIDPGSNINFITHKLAGKLQLEGTQRKIFMKRVNKEYTERE